jgi:hypothetical protein
VPAPSVCHVDIDTTQDAALFKDSFFVTKRGNLNGVQMKAFMKLNASNVGRLMMFGFERQSLEKEIQEESRETGPSSSCTTTAVEIIIFSELLYSSNLWP